MKELNSDIELFKKITQDDLDMMYHCLDGYKKKFIPGETILNFDNTHSTVGIVASGVVRLERIDYYGDLRTVDTNIKRLREKLGSKSNYIITVRGSGYKFEIPNEQ